MKYTKLLSAFLAVFFLIAGTAGFAQSSARGGAVGGNTGKNAGTMTYGVTVNSNVRGAVIYIDNVRQTDTAPASFTLPGGNHTFKVTAPGYDTYERTINISGALTVNAILNAVGHTLKIQSNVNNATVYLNNTRHGTAPVEITVSPGRYTLKVTAPRYKDYETTINVNRNDTITAYLQPMTYTLSVNSNIRNARVAVNGRTISTAPARTEVTEGSYTIAVSAPGYIDFQAVVEVKSDTTVNATLLPALASVTIELPSIYLDQTRDQSRRGPQRDDDVNIYVDDQLMRTMSFQITPGKHTIRITSGAFVIEKELMFESAKNYTIQPYMDIIAK